MSVPPMQFSVQLDKWESNQNRIPSRHISKYEALHKMMEDPFELQVIQPFKATAWSQVHLVLETIWELALHRRLPRFKQMDEDGKYQTLETCSCALVTNIPNVLR